MISSECIKAQKGFKDTLSYLICKKETWCHASLGYLPLFVTLQGSKLSQLMSEFLPISQGLLLHCSA